MIGGGFAKTSKLGAFESIAKNSLATRSGISATHPGMLKTMGLIDDKHRLLATVGMASGAIRVSEGFKRNVGLGLGKTTAYDVLGISAVTKTARLGTLGSPTWMKEFRALRSTHSAVDEILNGVLAPIIDHRQQFEELAEDLRGMVQVEPPEPLRANEMTPAATAGDAPTRPRQFSPREILVFATMVAFTVYDAVESMVQGHFDDLAMTLPLALMIGLLAASIFLPTGRDQ